MIAKTVAERQQAFKAAMKMAGYVKLEAWVTLEQREKFRELGGDEWLRKKIDAANVPPLESDEGGPTEALWVSPSGIEYRKQRGEWRQYSRKFPGHWNGSVTLGPLDAELLDAIAALDRIDRAKLPT